MTSETGTQTVSINILSDISKSKFGQLIEYNLRNVFLINHAQLKTIFLEGKSSKIYSTNIHWILVCNISSIFCKNNYY